MPDKKKNVLKANFSKADKMLQAVPLFASDDKVKVNSIKTEYLDEAGRAYLNKVNKGLSQRYRDLMEKQYRFNPENS